MGFGLGVRVRIEIAVRVRARGRVQISVKVRFWFRVARVAIERLRDRLGLLDGERHAIHPQLALHDLHRLLHRRLVLAEQLGAAVALRAHPLTPPYERLQRGIFEHLRAADRFAKGEGKGGERGREEGGPGEGWTVKGGERENEGERGDRGREGRGRRRNEGKW